MPGQTDGAPLDVLPADPAEHPTIIPAAGTLPWRRTEDGALEVALVHRSRYDDWSWPKGKLDPGERTSVAAVRETWEEMGLRVRLGIPLPSAEYLLLDKMGAPATKTVRYWAATVIGGAGVLEHEIDAVAWLTVPEANMRLSYARDREQLSALVRADKAGHLDTWPMLIIRHAKALPRKEFRGDNDQLRPLDEAGKRVAQELVPIIAAYDPHTVVTSKSKRCLATITPYAKALGTPVRTKQSLTEEGFAADPEKALKVLSKAFDASDPVAICSHGPLLPDLLHVLVMRCGGETADPRRQERLEAAGNMVKGEVLVAHLSGSGPEARVIATERHLPHN